MDKNADTYAFATHCFFYHNTNKNEYANVFAILHPLLTWSLIADTNIVIY